MRHDWFSGGSWRRAWARAGAVPTGPFPRRAEGGRAGRAIALELKGQKGMRAFARPARSVLFDRRTPAAFMSRLSGHAFERRARAPYKTVRVEIGFSLLETNSRDAGVLNPRLAPDVRSRSTREASHHCLTLVAFGFLGSPKAADPSKWNALALVSVAFKPHPDRVWLGAPAPPMAETGGV